MTGLFKCVVVSCAFSLVFGLTSVRDDVSWFKNGQRIKNRFVTGVVNGITDFDCSDSVNGENVEGECLSKVECLKIGGKVGGLCSLLGSCCVIEKTCGQSTSSKLSYFVRPSKLSEICPLTVNIYSKDVCQIRLDFERFNIAQPTSRTNEVEGQHVREAYKCHDDQFWIENVNKNLGFVHLCGKNDKQHIYIPVSENQQKVVLTFKFKSRNETKLINPDWRIRIRQLECKRSGYEHILTAPSKLMAMYNTLKNKKKPNSDYEWIAPSNCLQYFPNRTGSFESFNYNDGKGCYIGNLHYAICFRKNSDVCSATYTVDGVFQMNSNKYKSEEEQVEKYKKCHPDTESGSEISQDYIYIPGGVDSSKHSRQYYCNRDFTKNSVTAKAFGHLVVGVHTDDYRPNSDIEAPEEADEFAEVGFRLRYDLTSGDC